VETRVAYARQRLRKLLGDKIPSRPTTEQSA